MSEKGFQALSPVSVDLQIKRLKKYFPSIKFQVTGSDNQGFVILNWKSFSPDYVKALDKVLKKLNEIHNTSFKNMYQGKFISGNFRETEETSKAFEKIKLSQGHENCAIIPAKIGTFFVGESLNDSLPKIKNSNEFGLTFFHIALVILTHYEQIAGGKDLWINCAGDEIANADCEKQKFDCAPLLCIKPKQISMCSHPKSDKFAFSGIAVGSQVAIN